jgi:hypothetical protein
MTNTSGWIDVNIPGLLVAKHRIWNMDPAGGQRQMKCKKKRPIAFVPVSNNWASSIRCTQRRSPNPGRRWVTSFGHRGEGIQERFRVGHPAEDAALCFDHL